MDTKSGTPMPTPTDRGPGSSSKAFERIRQQTFDSWNKFGNQSAEEALATDKSTTRAPLDPKTAVGPSGS